MSRAAWPSAAAAASAGGQVDAAAQQGQRRGGRDVPQRWAVCGAEDILRVVELAQVDQGGGEREQRLDLAGIRRGPGAVPRRITQQLEPVADLAAVPADDRAGEEGRRGGVAVVLAWSGQNSVGYRSGEFVAQTGQSLQVRGQRLVPQAAGQLWPGQDQLGLVGSVPGLAAGTQDRGQGAPQPILGRRRQRPGQHVPGDRSGLVQPTGRGQGLGGGHRTGQRGRIARRGQLQRAQRQPGRGLRRRAQRLRRRPVQPGQRRGIPRMSGLEQVTGGPGR